MSAHFQFPMGITRDLAGNVLVGDCGTTVSTISPAGQLSRLAGTGGGGGPTAGIATRSDLACPAGIAVDPGGAVYIGDAFNSLIEKVTPVGILSIIAGNGTSGTPVPGPALRSPLESPTGLALDPAGNLYVGDRESEGVIYKITPAGQLVIVAGNGSYGAPVPGPALDSPLGNAAEDPGDVAVDSQGNLYLADGRNNVIEKVTPAGMLSIVAGEGPRHPGLPIPGAAAASPLNDPEGVAVDRAGNLYVADARNGMVERITPAGILSVVAGTNGQGIPAYGGPATMSPLQLSFAVTVTPCGVLYVADSSNETIDRIGDATPAGPCDLSATAGDTTAALTFTTDDPGTAPVTGYQFSVDSGQTWTPLATTAGTRATRTARLTGLIDGTTYPVEIRAVNAHGAGNAGNRISVTPTAVTAPGPPSDVTASAEIGRLLVGWRPPGQPGFPLFTGYAVTVRDDTTAAVRVLRFGRVLSTSLKAEAGHRYSVGVAAVSPDRHGPDAVAPPVVVPYPAPRPSLDVSRAEVLTAAYSLTRVTCRVSTGLLRSCVVTSTARVRGQLIVVGRGHQAANRATRAITVPVVLNAAGRVLAARVGGVEATVTATITMSHPAAVLRASRGTRLQAGVVDAGRVLFAPASAALTASDRSFLNGLRRHLGAVRSVVCDGYTDNLGDRRYNHRLGLARARSTCAYLVHSLHLSAAAASFGETHPAATNTTAAGRAANRRVVIRLNY